MRDMIRAQLGWRGANTMVGLIDTQINMELREVAGLAKYREFLVEDHNIATVAADNPSYTLPSDIQHFEDRTVRYSNDNGMVDFAYLAKWNAGMARYGTDGVPRYFQRIGGNLVLYPGNTLAGSGVFFSYYRYPTELIADASVFPLPQMEQTVIQKVISVLARSTNTRLATLAKQDARGAYSAGRAQQ